MAAPKGHTKSGGRTKGTPNKITQELRVMISDFLQNNFVKIEKDFAKLSPKDRAKLYCDILPFGISKLTRHELDMENCNVPILISHYSNEEEKKLLENE